VLTRDDQKSNPIKLLEQPYSDLNDIIVLDA